MHKVMPLDISLQELWFVCSAFYNFLKLRREMLNAEIKNYSKKTPT